MKKITVERVSKTIHICDECGDNQSHHKCMGCGIDLCNKCGEMININPWTLTYNGCRYDVTCKRCSLILKPYIKKVMSLNKKLEQKVEKLEMEWKSRCMEPPR